MTKSSWFEVSKDGLANLMAGRDKGFLVLELIQNAWDQKDTTEVKVRLAKIKRGLWKLEVEDNDVEGFYDLSHAFTLYAPCRKRGDPEQRGRFNVGEKLVLALCDSAKIETTVGTVEFAGDNRHEWPEKRERGTKVTLYIRLSAEDVREIDAAIRLLIPPQHIVTKYNGDPLMIPMQIHSFEAVLPTVVDEGDGVLRRTTRKAKVELYGVPFEGGGYVYEMGIPIVKVGDRWSYNVMQKVPLTQDRENIPPAYLSQLRVATLNEAHTFLSDDDAQTEWVRQAAGDTRATAEAVTAVLDKRFGKNRVAFDPSDIEANKNAINQGYTVVYGRSLTPGEWANATKAGAILPAGQVLPSKAPPPTATMPEPKWTTAQREMADYARQLFGKLCGGNLEVVIGEGGTFAATFRSCGALGVTIGVGPKLTLFWDKLSQDWFDGKVSEAVDALLIHEFAHNDVHDHLTPEYHLAVAVLGARLKMLALDEPEFFDQWERG